MPSTFHTFEITGCAEELRVIEFEGSEAMSELFHFQVTFFAQAPVVFADAVGMTCLLQMGSGDHDVSRPVNGLVARLEEVDVPGRAQRLGAVYRATVVPKPSRLQHRRNTRIFQEMSAPEVIKKVLDGAGLKSGDDYQLSLRETYVVREYCVQYRESDWDFVSRLCEEEGVCYYFEHAAEKHVLVFGDGPHHHEPITPASLVYRAHAGALASHAAGSGFVSKFGYGEEIRSGTVVLRDFDFKKPSLLLESKSEASVEAALEIYDYPGEYTLSATGDQLGKVRLEEQQAFRKTGAGNAASPLLTSGYKFTLEEHAREAYNREYLVTRVEHRGSEPTEGLEQTDPVYTNRFEVIPSDVTFRPSRVTPQPRIRGVQTAIVVGPAGEEIHTDEHGRVKVQFHWDRLGKKDDKSSCWIRVSQLWAGAAWGAIFIPRIGHEVVVSFEEGDPDRPLIVGRVYHGTNVPPYSLPANKTRSTIKSDSSTGGEGFNELRFEDKKGSEEVFFHAQKDHNGIVENDENWLVKHDQTLEVTHDRTKKIDHDQKLTVGNDDTIEVKHDRMETIDNDETVLVKHDRKTTINNDHTSTVKGLETRTVEKARSVTYNDTQTTKIAKDHTVTVGGAEVVTVTKAVAHTYDDAFALKIAKAKSEAIGGAVSLKIDGDQSVSVGGASKLAITGDSSTAVDGAQKVVVAKEMVFECGQAKLTLKADGTILLEGVKIEIKGSGPMKINGATIEVKSDATAKVEAAAKIDIKAPILDLSGSGSVKVASGAIKLG